jgi:hypothetical protein
MLIHAADIFITLMAIDSRRFRAIDAAADDDIFDFRQEPLCQLIFAATSLITFIHFRAIAAATPFLRQLPRRLPPLFFIAAAYADAVAFLLTALYYAIAVPPLFTLFALSLIRRHFILHYAIVTQPDERAARLLPPFATIRRAAARHFQPPCFRRHPAAFSICF